MNSTSLAKEINEIAAYLARRDVPALDCSAIGGPADVPVLLGSGLMEPILSAGAAWHAGCAKILLVSGGMGHSTPRLWERVVADPEFGDVPALGRPEADIIRDILIHHLDVPVEAIRVERKSTNCGSNAIESYKLLGPVDRMILIQDPTMQRRSHACFERAWREAPPVEILSYAPFVPQVTEDASALLEEGVWPFPRFISLILGEIPRLRDDENGYGPMGKNFIDHVEIPPQVLEAYEHVLDAFPNFDHRN